MVLTILAVAAVVGVVVCEPACSRFEYEKQTLEKVIRMEFAFERQSEEYKELKNRILDILEQVKDERKDIEHEKANVQKLQSDLRETMSVHSDNAQKLMAAVDTLDTEVRDNVRKLMSEVARNQSLLADTLNTTVRQTLDTVRHGSPIFFSYRGVSSTPSLYQAFVFTTKTAERGTSGYDASTGRFTASVSGLYIFTVNACLKTYLNLQIIHDDAPLLASSHYSGSGPPCFSLQAFADLTSGQQVWVKCWGGCNYYQDDGYGWMQFSGALIQKA